MTMAFKYQVVLSATPSEIFLVTLNHMDAIRSFVSDAPTISGQVENVYKLLILVSMFLLCNVKKHCKAFITCISHTVAHPTCFLYTI